MKIEKLFEYYHNHFNNSILKEHLNVKKSSALQLKGLKTSAQNIFLASYFIKNPSRWLFILNDKEEAAYVYNDLSKLLDERQVLFFASSYKRTLTGSLGRKIDNAGLIMRTEVLNILNSQENPQIIISYPEAVTEKVITRQGFNSNTLQLKSNDEVPVDFIVEVLTEYEFERVDFVYSPGQFSVRGSIVDIFSFSNDYPYRIDFFGDEIESIRTFDVITQLSKAKFDEIAIIPNLQNKHESESRIPFVDFISSETVLVFNDLEYVIERMNSIYEVMAEKFNQRKKIQESDEDELIFNPNQFLTTGNVLKERLENFRIVETGNKSYLKASLHIDFNIQAQPDFNKNFQLLAQDLTQKIEKGYKVHLFSDNSKQIERLTEIFKSEEIAAIGKIDFKPVNITIHEGFIDDDLKICCYTDHQIFKRYHRFKLKDSSQDDAKRALTLKEINELQPGDYVVHVDHGIGVFGGLQQTRENGQIQEAVRLVFKDNDVLLVNIHSLHRISKYKSKEGQAPKIYKLGSGAWSKLKNKTKKKVKDIAEELIKLYAKRKEEKGFAFTPDSYLQTELESSFIYEDTPDQLKSTLAIKADMESATPMDRLICGDVGFGKTEVAVRAAFKAVADNKQVAVLVPTTILALQHFRTFSERLKEFPCTVDYISRLKTTKEQKETLKNLAEGKIDILIGTHRLVSKDVKFKDLGLMVVDEEQKFGVTVKEKLKQLKVNIDTLTLTATPIPRTIQFSLMGARDLSVIQTPPPNRYPILTEVHRFNEEIIRNAIMYEVERNGQVYFIHNRVQNITEVEAMINRICPEVRTVVAHGQMEGKKLEKKLLDFINEEYGVLIATTIIENGLDIPNANTMIINNAQNFGLSDLHQLRGRVGRSNKKAFCYLLTPPPIAMSNEARRRIKAIEDFSDLGSGFQIALQDLDIRGAGNLLGAEQSGFISDIGYETYQRILDEALFELRENEFKELFMQEQEKTQAAGKLPPSKENLPEPDFKFVTDCQIDTDMELVFPESYIENVSERIKLYRTLDNVKDEEGLKKFQTEISDRFGKIPEQSIDLLNVVRLRWLAINLAIEKIVIRNKKMTCYFIADQNSPFYSGPKFMKILQFVQKEHRICQLSQTNNKLKLIFKKINSIEMAMGYLYKVLNA